ncbi:CMD domain-containing protein [Ignatzschineria sp. LJL83]
MSRSEQDVDLIDTLLDIDDNSTIYAARHFRDEVLVGTQESYDALFSEELSLPLNVRFLVALYASKLSQAKELTAHYEAALRDISVTRDALEEEINGVLIDDLTLIEDPTVQAILAFTRTLILNPLASDKNALLALEASGVSVADCIALAQLIAFLSYQIRLVSGLRAMQTLEKSA